MAPAHAYLNQPHWQPNLWPHKQRIRQAAPPLPTEPLHPPNPLKRLKITIHHAKRNVAGCPQLCATCGVSLCLPASSQRGIHHRNPPLGSGNLSSSCASLHSPEGAPATNSWMSSTTRALNLTPMAMSCAPTCSRRAPLVRRSKQVFSVRPGIKSARRS